MNKTRYGNKSVVAEIREDEDMPYTKDGRRIDLLINLLAIINRTTSFVLYELFINGASYQITQKMKSFNTLKEKEELLFEYISVLNEKQSEKMYSNYKKLKKKEKEEYIQDTIDNGIYIHQSPMWETMPIFYRCQNLLKKYPFITSNDLYIKKWGREYKVLTKYFVGEMYILKLKQSDRRGFSARSTGALDSKSLPTRSFKSKSHLERISSSCIRFGEFESLNFSIGILPEDIALFHALYRTSIKGRKDIISVMFDDDNAIQKIDASYTSRVAEIFNVRLKSLGIGLEFVDEDEEIKILNDKIVSEHTLDGKVYMCTDYQFFIMERIHDIKCEIMEENPILTSINLKEMIEEVMRKRKYINGPLFEDIENFEELVEEELNREYEKYKMRVEESLNEMKLPDEKEDVEEILSK